MLPPQPISTLFPYTTLFRSVNASRQLIQAAHPLLELVDPLPQRMRSEEHTSELQSRGHLVCRLLLEKKTRIAAESTKLYPETAPACSRITYSFAAKGNRPPVTVVWRDGSLYPPRPKEITDPLAWPFDTSGQLWIGDAGKLIAGIYGENPRLLDEAKQAEVT